MVWWLISTSQTMCPTYFRDQSQLVSHKQKKEGVISWSKKKEKDFWSRKDDELTWWRSIRCRCEQRSSPSVKSLLVIAKHCMQVFHVRMEGASTAQHHVYFLSLSDCSNWESTFCRSFLCSHGCKSLRYWQGHKGVVRIHIIITHQLEYIHSN